MTDTPWTLAERYAHAHALAKGGMPPLKISKLSGLTYYTAECIYARHNPEKRSSRLARTEVNAMQATEEVVCLLGIKMIEGNDTPVTITSNNRDPHYTRIGADHLAMFGEDREARFLAMWTGNGYELLERIA